MSDHIYSKLLGSSIAGLMEVTLFHPLDTVSKRLMSNEQKLVISGNNSNIKNIILNSSKPKYYNDIPRLYNGIEFSFIHRFTQRMYTYGGQPILRKKLENYFNNNTKKERVKLDTFAGLIIGAGESIFMPFDVLKIKKQTNPEAFKNRNLTEIIRKENISNYYKGFNITTARNMVAIGNLYFMNSLIREYYYNESNQRNMEFKQYLLISFITTNISIFLTSPFDVIKTRMQNKNFGDNPTILNISYNLLKYEGPIAFYKGLIPKLFTIGPKITFSFTMANYLISLIEKN